LACAAAIVFAALAWADETRKTAARPTAEAGFAALREAAAKGDGAVLAACLPDALVAKWPDDAKDTAAWRGALAKRIAEGAVVSVKEEGDSARARWKTSGAVLEIPLAFASGRWVAASPWAWLVGGADLAKANGKEPARVKLRARTSNDAYGPSAYSFTHVTQDPEECKNRMDVWFCGSCNQLHFLDAMASPLKARSLAELDGWQAGGDWMDEVVPRVGQVYAVNCSSDGRRDFQVGLRVAKAGRDAVELEWRITAAGKNAPANIRRPQPLVSNDGADGCAGMCGKPGK
jgi:hypothetical protein